RFGRGRGRPMQVGIVIPTLNSARTLEWTLLSLLRQDGCEMRLVVADSNSSDGTLEICARWNVPVIQVPAGNMYRAINAGLRTFVLRPTTIFSPVRTQARRASSD